MFLGVPGLKKTAVSLLVLIVAGVGIVSCGSGGSSSTQHKASGLKYRAFVSNALFPSGTINNPVLNIVDATQDVLSPSTISLLTTATQPELMALSPDLSRTLVFSPIGNTIAIVDNTTEAIAANGSTSVPGITLPGLTQSMFVASDNATAYAAVPSALVNGQAPGAVVAMDITTGTVTATVPVVAAQYIVPSPDGSHILVFSENSDVITIIATVLIGSNENPITTVSGFDRPVWAIFSSNTTAYIFNCGPECGGKTSGIATYTVGSSGPSTTKPVSGATYGLLNGNTLYVAGTPPNTHCGPGTAATTCGILSVVDAGSLAVTRTVVIADGYHDRMQMGSNGQLFIGSYSCTSINVIGGEVRGCLSIFNTTTGKVIVPPQTGDATGIQPIAGRNVVYVCEGGAFEVFDTTTDVLEVLPLPLDIIGQSYDVKLVDPPPTD
jgi:hypothetical protein